MAAVSDRCGIHFYAHPAPKIKKPVKCECMKHETTSSDHHYKAGARVGSDAVFMTSDQLKKKRAFSKMFLPNYKNRYNMAIKSLNIPEESCYKCCQKFHDEMKESFAARNNEAQKTDKEGKPIPGDNPLTRTDAYGWVINEVTPFAAGTGYESIKVQTKGAKPDTTVFCNWS